jgi:hypothetical protein
MKGLLIGFMLMGFVFTAFAQVTVKGVIRNGPKPIGYATIGIKGTTRSAMSNEHGEFTIIVTRLPQTVIVSAIGFEVEEFNIQSTFVTIELKPKVYEIKEVSVKSDAAYRMFDKAYKRLLKPGYIAFNGKVFYRLITQNDTVYTEFMEGFYNVQANPTGFNYWRLKHGRYAIVDDYREKHYVMSIDFSALMKYMDITNGQKSGVHFPLFPFRPNAGSLYAFTLNGYTYLHNREVSKILFSPKIKNNDAFEGTAFIHEESGNLHRLEVTYGRPSSSLIRSQYTKEPAADLAVKYTIDFTEDPSGRMLISWVDIDLKYVYVHDGNRTPIHSQLRCFVYEKETELITSELQRTTADKESGITKNSIRTLNGLMDVNGFSDYEAIRSRFYIKSFWEENQVIAQTALQQKITAQFEEKRSFGRAFNDVGDTLSALQEGYVLLGQKENRLMSVVPESTRNIDDPGGIVLTLDGKQCGALNSRLLVSYNCYKDSFYLSVLPVMDTTLTWMSDSLKRDDIFSHVFKYYSRLTAVSAKQLKSSLLKVISPCDNELALYDMIRKANEDLFNDQLLLINDLWKGNEFPFWERYLRGLEKEY